MRYIISLLFAAFFAAGAQSATLCESLASPDGSLKLVFENGQDGMFWSLTRKGKTLVAPSRLGLSFALFKVRGRELGEMRVVEKKERSSEVFSTGWKFSLASSCCSRSRSSLETFLGI